MNPQPTGDLHVQQLLSLLRRRAKMIIAAGCAGAILAGIAGLIIPPRYTGKAQLVINNGAQNGSGQAALNGFAHAADDVAIETHVAMLTSQRHLQRVLDSFHAELANPEKLSAEPESETILGNWLKFGASEAVEEKSPAPIAIPVLPAAEIAAMDRDVLARDLNVFRERRSRVIGVSFTSKNPGFAAEVANRAVRLYLEDQIERERTWTQKELAKIDERLPQARSEAEKSSASAQLYQIEHGLLAPRKDDAIDPNLAELSRQLNLAKSDLAERQERLIRLKNLQRSDRGLPTLLDALGDTELTELHERESKRIRSLTTESASLSAQVPEQAVELQQKMNGEIAQKVSSYEDEAQVLAARVHTLQQSVATLQKTSTDAREHEMRLRELQLEAKLANQLYENLVSRQREMRDKWDTQAEVRVLALAPVPDEPSSPSPILFILPALVLSLIPASLLAILLEKSDQSLRSEQEISTVLAVPCLGAVPKLNRRQRQQPHLQLLHRPQSPYAKSIRSVVASALQLTRPKGSSKLILVTSSVAGEGAATLALSFASYAAQLQRRVLLVGADSLHPPVIGHLEDKGGTGTTNDPASSLAIEPIRHAPDLGIDYLALAGDQPDPVAFLSNAEMPAFLHRLREAYDCVVIDSPPVLGTTETQLLVPLADSVILAVKWGDTPRLVVQNALSILRKSIRPDAVQRDVISTVITQVDLKRHARYRFGDSAEMLFRLKPQRNHRLNLQA